MSTIDRPRIVFLFPEFPLDNPITGGEKYNAVMLRAALQDPGLDAVIVPGAQALPAQIRQQTLLRRVWYQIACLWAVILRPCDLLVTDGSYHSWVLLALIYFDLFRRAPMVAMAYHVRHVASNRTGVRLKLERWGERALYRRMQHVITCSHAAKADFVRDGLQADRIEVIYPATDVDLPARHQVAAWRQKRVTDPIMRILYVGQCYERKGLHVLLQACAELDMAWIIDVIGKYDAQSDYYRRLQSIIEQHSLGDRVRFRGFVSQQELAEAYHQADLFCLPSLHEGYGIVLVEAMGYGLPIVATTAGSIPELVEHEQSGLLVPPANPGALAQALVRIATSPELYDHLAQGAYERAQTLLKEWHTVAEEVISCLRRWANQPQPE